MENRKYLIIILSIFLTFFLKDAYAYPTEVHEFITQEALSEYNQEDQHSFTVEEENFIKKGAIHEDAVPRWMNHFFDPIYKRGLSSDSVINPFLPIGKWNDAPVWANNWEVQDKNLYKSFQMFSDASIFDGLEINKTESAFVWNRALYEWIKGDRNTSLFILGHVLHLIQDMFVPDHTRNDAHPVNSPYEDYTQGLLNKEQLFIEKISTIPSHETLEEYFNAATLYSNKNFYSEDTIGIQSGYENPTPSSYEIYNDRVLLVRDGIEGEGEKIFLAIQTPKYGNNIALLKGDVSVNDRRVLKSYWNELSPRSVAYTIGVINFFFSEIEKYKNNPEELIRDNKEGFFLGNILNSIEGSFSKIGENLLGRKEDNRTYRFLVENNTRGINERYHKESKVFQGEVDDEKQKEETDIEEDVKELDKNNKEKKGGLKESSSLCSIDNISPKYFPVVFSEIAWMGNTENSSNEWIELQNITSSKVDVEGWGIRNEDESIQIMFDDAGVRSLDPGQIIIFERTNDDSVPHIESNGIYKGTLRNSGNDIYLFDGDCRLIDSIIAGDGWPAGNNTDKRTMERDIETLEWYTSSRIHGTPKERNSKHGIENKEDEESTSSPIPTTTPGSTPIPASSQDPEANEIIYANVSISEIMYDLEGNDTGREWVEIKNEDNQSIDLDGWRFFEHDVYHSINHIYGEGEITPGGYAILADKPEVFLNENPNFNGSIFDSSFSLSNEGELIALYAGDRLVDSYAYQNIKGGNGNGNSLQLHESKWGEGSPTPGYENNHNPITKQENEEEFVTVDHMVISEIQVSGDFGIEEFIELYNPLSKAIDLSDYSLQYASGRNEEIGNIYKINLEGEIKGQSYLLLANRDSSFSEIADETFSFSLSGQDAGGLVMLVDNSSLIEDINNISVVDYVAYGSDNILPVGFIVETPPDNKSIERKALYKGKCVSPIGDYEFKGNGCDRESEEDFIIRDNPFPQNSYSQKEPRERPQEVSSVSYLYDDFFKKISLRWEYDDEDTTFLVEDKGNEAIIYETNNTAFDVNLKELNVTHTISIYAKDKGGYLSQPFVINEKFLPKSFIEGANFYVKDDKTIFDIFISKNDFIPDFFGRGSEGVLVFSINKKPLNGEVIEISPTSDFSNWSDSKKNDVTKVTFHSCRGERTADMVSIKNVSGDCGIAYDVERLEEGIIRIYPNIEWDPGLLTEDDFISISFYNLYSNWSHKVYRNVGIDNEKYSFSKKILEKNIPPTPPRNVRVIKSGTEEYILWDSSYDEDGFDDYVRYEMAVVPPDDELTESLWRDAYLYYSDGELRGPNIQYSIVGTYIIHIRAIDELGSSSELSTIIIER